MSSPLHSAQKPSDGIHVIVRYVFADSSARSALNDTNYGTLTLTSTDVGSVAHQVSDNTFWILSNHSPVTWTEISDSGATGAAGGDLSGTYPNPSVAALTSGATSLAIGAINDGDFLVRSGTDILGTGAGFNPGRTILVAKTGGTETTIADGIVAAKALSPPPDAYNPAVIIVYPGVYVENTLNLVAGITISSSDGPNSATIEAAVPNSTIINASESSLIRGVTISGASGPDGYGIKFNSGTADAKYFRVRDVRIQDCTHCISIDGYNSDFIGNDIFIRKEVGDSIDIAVSITQRAVGRIDNLQIESDFSTNRIGYGLIVDGYGTYAHITNLSIVYADNAIIARNGGDLHAHSPCELREVRTGIYLTTGATFIGVGVNIEERSAVLDLNIDDPSVTAKIVSGLIRNDNVSIDPNCTILAQFISDVDGDEGLQVYGEFSVGSEDRPTESIFGGGDSHTRNMVILQNTNQEVGAWINATQNFSEDDGYSSSVFIDVTAGNTIYVGAEYKFPGLKADVTSVLVLGAGALIAEYWNGASWIEFNVMATKANSPYTQYGQTPIQRAQSEHVRFGVMTAWARKTLNGVNKYWARYRITSDISSAGEVDQFKIHTSRTEINSDGRIELFGSARQSRFLPFRRNILDPIAGSTPTSQNISISANIVLAASENQFSNNAVDSKGGVIEIPLGLDTSVPLTVDIYWYAEGTTGNVELELQYATFIEGDVLNGTASETSDSKIITVPGVANTLVRTAFTVPVKNLVPDNFIAIRLFRDGTGGNADDTLAADIVIVEFDVEGTFWR